MTKKVTKVTSERVPPKVKSQPVEKATEKGFVHQPFILHGVPRNPGDPITLTKDQFKNFSDKSCDLVGKDKPKGETKEAKGGVEK